MVTMEQIKTLRNRTGAGVVDAKKALTESDGDMEKAILWLREKGKATIAKKSDRETNEGIVGYYIHSNKKLGVLVSLVCETDFVARNEQFQNLGKEIAMQVASMDPEDVKELLAQDYIRDSSKTIETLVKELIAKTGENIQVKNFNRISI